MNHLHRLPRAHIAVYLLYLAAATLITWPLVTVFTTELIGHPFGDSYELTRHIWWIKHAIQSGGPLFFDQPLLGYPDGMGGAWLWANPLQSFPAWLFAFVMPLPAAYNLMVLLRLALNGWALHWLVWRLTGGQRIPALLAGLVFLAYPTFQGQLAGGHAGLLALWPLPFYAYALTRLREGGRRWPVITALLFLFSAWGNTLLLVYATLPVTAFFLAGHLFARNWRTTLRTGGAVFLGAALTALFLLPLALETVNTPERLSESGVVRFSADVLSVVTPSFFHPVFGGLTYTHRVLGVNPVEGPGYIGVIAALLVAVAVVRQRAARGWLALAVTVWILSLGPLLKFMDAPVTLRIGQDEFETYVTLPWSALQNLPLLNITRTPSRFNFTVALAVSVMVGYGAAHLWRRHGGKLWRWPALVVVMGAVLWEYQTFWPLPTVPGDIPRPIAELAEREDVRAVLNLPWAHLLAAKDALYLQTAHQRPLVAGHVTRRTPVDPAKLTLLETTLDPALLDAAGADIIIVHRSWDEDGAVERFARARLGDPFYEDARFALWERPVATAPPEFAAFTVPQTEVTDRGDFYLYAPQAGWARLGARLAADGRGVSLYLNGGLLHRWTVEGEVAVEVPLPFPNAGYYTASFRIEPPCPGAVFKTLQCRALQIDGLTLTGFEPGTLGAVRFGGGLVLGGAAFAADDDAVSARLWWRFEGARGETDVRFVHIIGPDGALIAQNDGTLGQQPPGGAWSEAVTLPLPDDLEPGAYRVYTGWYSYPEIARFPVLDDVPGAQDGLVYLGSFTLPE